MDPLEQQQTRRTMEAIAKDQKLRDLWMRLLAQSWRGGGASGSSIDATWAVSVPLRPRKEPRFHRHAERTDESVSARLTWSG